MYRVGENSSLATSGADMATDEREGCLGLGELQGGGQGGGLSTFLNVDEGLVGVD